jgi:hypothetical protein
MGKFYAAPPARLQIRIQATKNHREQSDDVGLQKTLYFYLLSDLLLLFAVVLLIIINVHYCLVSLMWMKIGSNDITAQVPGVS